MESKNLPNMSRHLTNQPVVCPWTSKAPFSTTNGLKNFHGVASTSTLSTVANNLSSLPTNNDVEEKTSIQQSSSQFFHFLRLMQLFPDVHPATLHSVMSLCKNDFFGAVDKLLYAKRCKNYYMNQRNGAQQTSTNFHRYQPYVFNVKRNDESNKYNNSASTTNQTASVTTFGSNACTTLTNKATELKKTVYKNKSKAKDKTAPVPTHCQFTAIAPNSSTQTSSPESQPEDMTISSVKRENKIITE